jgi:hypothetical protein
VICCWRVQVLTRPPAALKQQLVNLAVWLRIPLAQLPTSPPAPPAAADTVAGVQLAGPDLAACQELMQLVNRRPGVLFLSESAVRHQLTDIQVRKGLLRALMGWLRMQMMGGGMLLKLLALSRSPSHPTAAPVLWPYLMHPTIPPPHTHPSPSCNCTLLLQDLLKLPALLNLPSYPTAAPAMWPVPYAPTDILIFSL